MDQVTDTLQPDACVMQSSCKVLTQVVLLPTWFPASPNKCVVLLVDIGYLMINSFAAFFGLSPVDVPVERLGFYANQARQRPNTLVTSEHQHHWLLLTRALQVWRTTTKRLSKLRDSTALWGMLARLCDLFSSTEPARAAMTSALYSAHFLCSAVLAVSFCGSLKHGRLKILCFGYLSCRITESSKIALRPSFRNSK